MPKEKIVKICDLLIAYGFLAIVFFIPIIFDFTSLSYNRIDLYKIVIFRVILSLILLAYTARIFIGNKLSFKGGYKIFLLVSFLWFSFFISSLFSIQSNQSFWGNFGRQQGFYNFFHYGLFFVLLVLNVKEFKQIRRIIMAVVAAASLASLYGLSQYFNLDPLDKAGNFLNNGRIFSSLGQPNFFGHYLILVLPLSFYALIFLAKHFWMRFFVGLAAAAQLVCLAFTYSRAAWLGFFGSMVFLPLAWLIFKRRKKAVLGLAGFLLIGLIAIIGLNAVKPAGQNRLYDVNIINRLKSIVDFSGGSNKMRLYYLAISLKEIRQAGPFRLFFGYGPETLKTVFIKYYRQDWGVYEAINSLPDRAHNWLFDQILALGFLGLAANLAFYMYLVHKAIKFLLARQKLDSDGWLAIFLFSALAAYFINNLFSFSLVTNYIYLFLILALGWLTINYRGEEKKLNIKLTVFSKAIIWASLLAALAVFIWTNNINQARAEIYYMKALKSMKISACPAVMSQMEKAVNLSPNNDYYQTNYVFLMLNCFPLIKDKAVQEQLRDNLLKTLESIKNKETYDILIIAARARTLFGLYLDKTYYQEAEKIYNGLIADFPYLTTAYEELGRQKMTQEDYLGAINIYKRALAILPPLDHPYLDNQHRAQIASIAVRLNEGLGQAYFKIARPPNPPAGGEGEKNYDLALAHYKRGLELEPYRATLYKNIADIYYVQGRLEQAIIWNQRGLTLNPADYNWPLALSLLYRDKKDLAKAKDYLNQALKLAPENAELKKYSEELNK